MRDHDDLQDLPIIKELGLSIRAVAASEDDRLHLMALQRSRHRRRLTLSATGIAFAGAAVIAVSSLIGGPGTTERANAASVLGSTARNAAVDPTKMPASDQYFYVRSATVGSLMPATGEAERNGDGPIPTAETREIWTSIERPGRLLVTPTANQSATPVPGNGRVGNISAQGGYRIGSLRLSGQDLQNLPTDPAVLLTRLRDGAAGRGASPDAQVFDDIGQALAEQPIPARIREALYRTLAKVPGVTLVQGASDSTTATVSLTTDGIRHELTFNIRTSALNAARTIAVRADTGPVETILNQTTYEARAITNAPERP